MDRPLKCQAGRLLPLAPLLAGGLWALALPLENRLQQSESEARQLQLARDALLARALTDDNRPGSLPCPDLLTDDAGLRNYPDDGKADNLTRNRCPSDLGRLPWATLALPPLRDRHDQRLWYAVAPGLYDDDNAEPINSDTPTGLSHAGQNQLAALLIAPGPALPGQHRPSSRPTDYLEDGGGNDRVLAISRNELMAAVETRIANQVQTCLLRHARGNDYPWPAPLAVSDGRGLAGSRFGRVPLSQPEPAPANALAAPLQNFADSRSTLPQPATAAQQQLWHGDRSESISNLRNFADALFGASQPLALAARNAVRNEQLLATAVSKASGNQRISRSEGSAIAVAANTSLDTWQSLPGMLADSGFDPWAAALAADLGRLPQLLALGPGNAAGCDLAQRLALSHSPHPVLQQALPETAATLAGFCSGDPLPESALLAAGERLRQALANRRSEILAADLELRLTALQEATMSAETQQALTLSLLERLQHGPAALLAERDQARHGLLVGDLPAALAALQQLVNSLRSLEQSEHNLSRSTLDYWLQRQQTALAAFVAQDLASPRPLQQAIVPYAQALADNGTPLHQLAAAIEAHSQQLAGLARAPAVAGPLPAAQSDSLLARAGAQLLLEQNAASTRENAERSPTRSNQQKADAALASAQAGGESLLLAGQELLTALAAGIGSTAAQAWPLVWRSAACDFLRTNVDSPGWWVRNRWGDSIFFQIDERLAAAPGRLRLAGRSQLSLVVLAAGAALPGQNRSRQRSADYLEGDNADSGRDGLGQQPSRLFSRLPRSTVNNDLFATPGAGIH